MKSWATIGRMTCVDGGGKLTLDGKQALSYSRIRYVGNVRL